MVRIIAIVCVAGVVLTGCNGQDVSAVRLDLDKLKAGEEVSLFNGSSLDGWKILDKIYYDRAGKVTAGDGTMILDVGQELTGVKWTGKVLRDEYEISLQARKLKGDDFFCGLTFPVRKQKATLIMGGWGGTAVGISNVDNFSAIENQTSQQIEFAKNRWYDIAVRVADGKIQVFLDHDKIIDQEIKGHEFDVWPQMEDVLPMGLATYCTKGEFRNIKYTRLQ